MQAERASPCRNRGMGAWKSLEYTGIGLQLVVTECNSQYHSMFLVYCTGRSDSVMSDTFQQTMPDWTEVAP